jgi:hypothetical protein
LTISLTTTPLVIKNPNNKKHMNFQRIISCGGWGDILNISIYMTINMFWQKHKYPHHILSTVGKNTL